MCVFGGRRDVRVGDGEKDPRREMQDVVFAFIICLCTQLTQMSLINHSYAFHQHLATLSGPTHLKWSLW